MTYDNPAYWRALHRTYPGSLKAVGHPWLSEALNELKYASEGSTLVGFLDSNRALLTRELPSRVLDLGAGTGFWTAMLQSWYREHGTTPQVTAVDLSEEALTLVKGRLPDIETIQLDLAAADPFRFREMFGMVASFYCLHHLPRLADFLNGLQLAARSVVPGGVLLLMDPVLSQSYSHFHGTVFSSHNDNGMPRSLNLIDDVLEREALDRISFLPAVSFILNGSIEARSRVGFAVTSRLWGWLQRAYRSERITRTFAGALSRTDAFLKRHALAFSSSLVAYRKRR